MSCDTSDIHASDNLPDLSLTGIRPAVAPRYPGARVLAAGPCSAESRRQVMETARRLTAANIDLFRAGIWKPRTRPGGFEGCGSRGLEWLREVKDTFGIPVATEVATPRHVDLALNAGVDVLWLGARTTTNPFAVHELAEALRGTDAAVMVKNPAAPDLELWIGAMQRLYGAGIRRLTAVHRGFSVFGHSVYRNTPHWGIPIELHRRYPQIQLLCDPSHIGGKRELIEPLARHASELGFNGLIVESHCHPDTALSDAAQQITPEKLRELADTLDHLNPADPSDPTDAVTDCRRRIDMIDTQLLELLSARMGISDEIGLIKKAHDMPVLQPDRYEALMQSRVDRAETLGLDRAFISKVLAAIHDESVNRQLRLKS